jgi:hypothetical protein
MNKSTRITVALVGLYAGLLGMVHGAFAADQGGVRPEGILFNALGPPCQPESVYHACFPAMTIIGDLTVAGILALLAGFTMVLWAALFVQRRRGGLVLMGLALILLLVGGGFIPFFTGAIAGAAGTQINGELAWLRRRLADRWLARLARVWPLALVLYFSWLLIQWGLGTLANEFVLELGAWPLVVELALLLLAICGAFAADAQHINEERS